MQLADPGNVIASMPPGSAIYARIGRPEMHTDFLVREESATIQLLVNPIVTIRPRLFVEHDIAVLVVMFQAGDNPEQIFETWWNYHQPDGYGETVFRDMMTQVDVAIHWYGDSGTVEKSTVIRNSLRDYFGMATEKIRALPPWTMQEFNDAREVIYKRRPTLAALWRELRIFNELEKGRWN